MTPFNQWAARWGIPVEAVNELRALMIPDDNYTDSGSATSETALQQQIRIVSSQQGKRLWRNNRGAVTTDDGRHIRYGLCNDSVAMNKVIKSHDLIGITPIIIQPEHIGQLVGVFTSLEVKKPSWKYKGTKHELAQAAWGNLVISMGGIAKFINRIEDL